MEKDIEQELLETRKPLEKLQKELNGYQERFYLVALSATMDKRYPFDHLKIDRSFIKDLSDDVDDEAIVSAVIGLSRNLHMEVIAEGVETEQQVATLQKLGCNAAQGYLYSKPLTSAEFTTYLKENQ